MRDVRGGTVRDERGLHKVREITPNETTDFLYKRGPDPLLAVMQGQREAEACRSRSNPQIRRGEGSWSCVLECAGMSGAGWAEVKAAVRQAPGHFGPCQRQAGVILPVKVAYRCSCLMTRAWHAKLAAPGTASSVARRFFDPTLKRICSGSKLTSVRHDGNSHPCFSQGDQTQGPDFRTGSATKALSSAMAASAHEGERSTPSQAEILTDTREWIFRLTWPESGAVFAVTGCP